MGQFYGGSCMFEHVSVVSSIFIHNFQRNINYVNKTMIYLILSQIKHKMIFFSPCQLRQLLVAGCLYMYVCVCCRHQHPKTTEVPCLISWVQQVPVHFPVSGALCRRLWRWGQDPHFGGDHGGRGQRRGQEGFWPAEMSQMWGSMHTCGDVCL